MAVNMLIGSIRQRGFTYIGLLMIIAIAGIAMAGVSVVWHQDSQREHEKELLFAGEAYRAAIGHYYESSPNGIKQFPSTLDDLLLDKRFPIIKRHIRKLYKDPVTADTTWGLIMQQEKIIGVYSRSRLQPIKKTDFSMLEDTFSGAKEYQDWKFIYTPGSISIPISPTDVQ